MVSANAVRAMAALCLSFLLTADAWATDFPPQTIPDEVIEIGEPIAVLDVEEPKQIGFNRPSPAEPWIGRLFRGRATDLPRWITPDEMIETSELIAVFDVEEPKLGGFNQPTSAKARMIQLFKGTWRSEITLRDYNFWKPGRYLLFLSLESGQYSDKGWSSWILSIGIRPMRQDENGGWEVEWVEYNEPRSSRPASDEFFWISLDEMGKRIEDALARAVAEQEEHKRAWLTDADAVIFGRVSSTRTIRPADGIYGKTGDESVAGYSVAGNVVVNAVFKGSLKRDDRIVAYAPDESGTVIPRRRRMLPVLVAQRENLLVLKNIDGYWAVSPTFIPNLSVEMNDQMMWYGKRVMEESEYPELKWSPELKMRDEVRDEIRDILKRAKAGE